MNRTESAEKISPLAVGAEIPDVTLLKMDETPVALRSLLRQPVILVFYRGGWCPYCKLQLAGLQEIEDDLKSMGFRILAVSPDLPEHLRASVDKGSLSYTLLSDSDMEAASAFGIAFRVDDPTVEKYKEFNIDLEAASGRKHHRLPVPAVFVIDQRGIVRFSHAHLDYKVRLSTEEVKAAAVAVKEEAR